jgi:hypothetical protein
MPHPLTEAAAMGTEVLVLVNGLSSIFIPDRASLVEEVYVEPFSLQIHHSEFGKNLGPKGKRFFRRINGQDPVPAERSILCS